MKLNTCEHSPIGYSAIRKMIVKKNKNKNKGKNKKYIYVYISSFFVLLTLKALSISKKSLCSDRART